MEKPVVEGIKDKNRVPVARFLLTLKEDKCLWCGGFPKRGFRSLSQEEWQIINLEALNRFEEGEEVDKELLQKAGLIKNWIFQLKF